jgi:hypothetical protein
MHTPSEELQFEKLHCWFNVFGILLRHGGVRNFLDGGQVLYKTLMLIK